jgi:hypothetical protein
MTTADRSLKGLLRASGFSRREPGRRVVAQNASLVAYTKGRPRLTASELRTLELHRLIAEKLEEDPERVLAIAKRNLELMRSGDHGGHSRPYLDTWQMLLEGTRRDLIRVMVSTDAAARDLRQASPFGGVLSDEERIDALLRTDGQRVAAKSGRSLEEIRLELLGKSASSAVPARINELAGVSHIWTGGDNE